MMPDVCRNLVAPSAFDYGIITGNAKTCVVLGPVRSGLFP